MKKLFSLLLTLLLIAPLCAMSVSTTVYATSLADESTSTDAMSSLYQLLAQGKYTYASNGQVIDVSLHKYKATGGGVYYYYEIIGATSGTVGVGVTMGTSQRGNANGASPFNQAAFEALTTNGRRKFLTDVFTLCNAASTDTARGYNQGAGAITEDTVNEFLIQIQDQTGMGSQLLATLLQNTKPNYVAANRIYQPFSGVIGTFLGLGAILIIAFLGVTMVMDIAYITIPAFQLFIGKKEEGGSGSGGKKSLAGLISQEAANAVEQSSKAGDDDKSLAITVYFKQRWIGITILGIALIYLVQGQIYTFVAMVIDLFSGFLGF